MRTEQCESKLKTNHYSKEEEVGLNKHSSTMELEQSQLLSMSKDAAATQWGKKQQITSILLLFHQFQFLTITESKERRTTIIVSPLCFTCISLFKCYDIFCGKNYDFHLTIRKLRHQLIYLYTKLVNDRAEAQTYFHPDPNILTNCHVID